MSTAKPLSTIQREANYLEQTGRAVLTPRQQRRVIAKQHEQMREFGVRTGRLRRRFDRLNDRQVKATSKTMAALNRMRVLRSRGGR